MTLQQLGRSQEARDALTHLRRLYARSELQDKTCLEEAEGVFAGRDGTALPKWGR